MRIIIWVASIMLLDLIIKAWVLHTLGFLHKLVLVGDVLWIIAVENLSMRWTDTFSITDALEIVLKLGFLFIFFRIQTRDVSKGFKWASAMIVFAWMGKLFDRLLFSHMAGHDSYVYMDYFYEGVITNSVTSITSIMLLAGWVLLVIVGVVRFGDVRQVCQVMCYVIDYRSPHIGPNSGSKHFV